MIGNYKSFEERMDWLLAFMVIDDPFSAELLTFVTPQESTHVDTMAVGVQGTSLTLFYNRKFVESLEDAAVRFVLAHEMHHLALHHITTRKPSDPNLMRKHNIAADLEINSGLKACCALDKGGFKSPPPPPYEGIFPKTYGLEEGLSLEQYLQVLPEDTNSEKEDGTGGGSSSGEGTGECSDVGKEESHGGFDSHHLWSDGENQLLDEMIRQKITQMANSDSYWGSMPGDLKLRILAAQKSKVPWVKLLRHTLGTIPFSSLRHTYLRPNRRFEFPYTGFKKECISRILILWDTSGSIRPYENSKFLSEVNRISEVNPIDVQMFDYTLQGKIIPFNRKMTAIQIEGGGGTSFIEPFELADKLRYDTVIVLTDGDALPIPKPKHVKRIIWVIIGADNNPPVKWGEVIHIDTTNGVAS